MKRGGKIALLCFFLPCEIFFVICTIPALFIFLPVGIVGVVVSVFFGIVVTSIIQSLKGKKPIMNLFREGQKTCKKCGTTFEKAKFFSCPHCAEEKRKNQPPPPTYEEMRAARLARKARKNAFWDFVGAIGVIGELSEMNDPPPQKRNSVLNSTDYDHGSLHSEEGHETEDGYCMECDMNVEDILE